MSHLLPEDTANTQAELLAENADLRARLIDAEAALNDPLRVRERQALLILNEMYQFVALLDTQGNELETNQTSLDAVHLRREDCIGHPFWEVPVWPVSILKDLQAAFQSVITTGEFMRFEVEFFVPGRETELLTTDITLKPIRNAWGEVAFVVLEGRDITERKRAEEEIARKNAKLQELYEQVRHLDQLKSLFFAMMNHELRTPLTLILGPTESLLQQASLAQEVRQVLEVVTRNGRLLLKLVNDLLEVSRLEAGKLQLHYVSCDLSRLVQLLAANFDTVAAERQLTYTAQTPPQLMAEIDPSRIERVLLNLLSNAFKFTPDGGSIACRLEMQMASNEASETSAQVVMTVQDSGPGVPVVQRDMIFERFRQAEEGSTRRFGGTGLGLAIVKDLIELHGGTVRVDEAPEGGARFTIRLPREAPAGTTVQREDGKSTQELTDARLSQTVVEELLPARLPLSTLPSSSATSESSLILVVEDHPQMREFLTAQLVSHYRVVEAVNGQEGLALARRLHPDLVLTDIMMPVMSGDEMLTALRADSSYDDIMVVVLSARGNEELRLNLLRAGAQDYLVKPFSPEELQVRLDNLLTLHRTRRLLQVELASSQQNLESLARELATRKRELEAINSELRTMNKHQSDFVAVVSHEFRTPLTSIQGFSELLSEQEWSPEEVKEYATDITKDARRLTRMITDLLDLERMKSGKTTLHCKPMDVNVLLRDLADQTQHTTAEHVIVYHLDEELPLVQGDQDKLIQVVANLLSNAIKYSPAGGEILLISRKEQDHIHISIQDQGMGIPEEALEDIFTPYSRIELEKTRYIRGTGLGLSVVREIISLHGGKIWVESTPGHGSTFHFSLPLTREVSNASTE